MCVNGFKIFLLCFIMLFVWSFISCEYGKNLWFGLFILFLGDCLIDFKDIGVWVWEEIDFYGWVFFSNLCYCLFLGFSCLLVLGWDLGCMLLFRYVCWGLWKCECRLDWSEWLWRFELNWLLLILCVCERLGFGVRLW